MRHYVHIGQAKCASTTLQNQFFAAHPDLHHLGAGHRGHTGRYADRAIARLVESGLRFQKDFGWRPDAARAALETHDSEAGDRRTGLSCEFLGFTLGNEIDVTTKARRVREILGAETVVVFVFREQSALLKSLYTELVKGGYPGTFRQFLEYTWLYQDRNWCLDLCHDRIIDAWAAEFGPERILALPFELLGADPARFLADLCRGLGIGPFEGALHSKNTRPPAGELELRRRFNEKWPHGFGGPFFRPFHSGRLQAWFEDELGVRLPRERALDDTMSQTFAAAAAEQAVRHEIPALDLEMPEALGERLSGLYRPANRRLADRVPYDLESLGYVLE